MKTDPRSGYRFRSPMLVIALAVCFFTGLAIGYRIRPNIVAVEDAPPRRSVPALVATIEELPASNPQSSSVPVYSPLDRLRALSAAGSPFDAVTTLSLIRLLSASECELALGVLRSTSGEYRRLFHDALAERWAEVDPGAAFSAAQRERDNDLRNRLGQAAGVALAAIDPEGALARITHARSIHARVKAAEWILPALAKHNPARAAEYLRGNEQLTRHEHLYHRLAREYARTLPQQAIAWAESLSTRRLREETVKHAWHGWAEADPASVARTLGQNAPKTLSNELHSTVSRSWSRADPFASLAWIESLADPTARRQARGSFEVDVRKLGTDAARQLVQSASSDEFRAHLADRVAEQLARDDPAKALAWAESLPEGAARTQALEPVLSQWVAMDPAAAARYIATLPESTKRPEYLRGAIQQWIQIEPEAAFAYVQQLPAGHERDAALGEAVLTIREEDSKSALQWFRTIQDPAISGKVAAELAGTLIKSDRSTALSLIAKVPAESQPKAYHNLIRNWAFEHTREAGEWIGTLPEGEARDAAISGYVSVIDGMDPARATEWAASIGDPNERTKALFEAFPRWVERDQAEATAWLEQTTVADALVPLFNVILDEMARERAERD